uniref:BRCT domain-containing protein n=1 Tax=Gouania willdenowi TaxID=441366 RepID=A0A8C5H8M9_GOUWI
MTTSGISSVLKDVVAYVDVWSADKTANYSKSFALQLQQMGAKVSKTFNKEVTHAIFNNGHSATWKKAKKNNVWLVSLLWISSCNKNGVQVSEEGFPALNDESNPVVKNKKHRCMRPKDSEEKTPDSDRRMRKKLDKMLKVLTPKEPVCSAVSSVFIDEENGIVYSPSLKRSDYMARRLKDMKEKRENLSPTFDSSDDESSATATKPDYSPVKEELRKKDLQEKSEVLRNFTKPSPSPCRDVPKNTSNQSDCPDIEQKKEYTKNPRRTSIRRREHDKPVSDMTRQGRRSSISKDVNKGKRSQIKSSDLLLNTPDKQNNAEVKLLTETKFNFYPEPVEASSCPPLSTLLDAGAAETSKEAPLQRGELKTPKRVSSSFSALVRSFTQSNDSKGPDAASTTGDDDVFEDYFSPANHQQRSKGPYFPELPAERSIHIPFDLVPVQKKRKQRKSVTLELISHDNKKRKLHQRQSEKNPNQQSDTGCLRKIHQEDDKGPLPTPHIQGAKESLMIQTLQQSPLGLKMINKEALTLKGESTSAQSTLPTEDKAVSVLQKNKNISHIIESSGKRSPFTTGFSGIPSDAEDDHQTQVSSTPQKMAHKSKAIKTLVMTSMPTEKQNIVFQLVKTLGSFSVVDRVCESTTHVVSGRNKRTLNILLGIARGCWILSFEWILWCLEQRQWISEEPYELSDQFPAAQICRLQRHLSAGEHQQDLFQEQPVMFVSQHSQPPTHCLVELIELCGGTVSKSVRQAGICIGKYNGRRPEGSRILSEQWVLDSITHLKPLSYDTYDLE